ncbi:MAG: hypothetical protein LWX51_05035 [Deltaproteobacteria bacterium]|jgi:hypothetical protein|nr:hypothetical protein [Deltaproteobacteria bacterium]
MSCNTLTETQFFSLVSTIAGKHGCLLVDIDVDKRIINIAGPSESEYACAVELEEILGHYMAAPHPSEFGAIENYLGLESIAT